MNNDILKSEIKKTILLDETQEQTLFNRAVKLLAAKPRSLAEMRDRLLKPVGPVGIDPNIVEAVLKRLVEYGYLNDERLAFGYASYPLLQNPIGPPRLQLDLSLTKVDRAPADYAPSIPSADI